MREKHCFMAEKVRLILAFKLKRTEPLILGQQKVDILGLIVQLLDILGLIIQLL